MKKATYFLIYVAALALGVLLLIFSQQPLTSTRPTGMQGVVTAAGIIFIAAGVLNLLLSMHLRRNADGVRQTRPWYLTAMSIAAILWGVLLVAMCVSMTYTLAVTLGVSMVIAALAQAMWIAGSTRSYGVSVWWYTVPCLMLAAGIVSVTLINDYTNPGASGSKASILAGIMFLLYGVNGFASLRRRRLHESGKTAGSDDGTSGSQAA